MKENNKPLDPIDRKMMSLLAEDGRMPAKEIADKLGITSPTVHSRMKHLIKSGVLKVAGLIDVFKAKNIIMAIVAIRIADDANMDETLHRISELDEIHCTYAVTGRYDIFAEVVFTGGMESLYDFMSDKLPTVGNIDSSESFVVMKTRRKWIVFPSQLKGWTT